MEQNNNQIIPQDQYEAMLLKLPLTCDCNICKLTIEMIQQNIEQQRLIELCKKLGFDSYSFMRVTGEERKW